MGGLHPWTAQQPQILSFLQLHSLGDLESSISRQKGERMEEAHPLLDDLGAKTHMSLPLS